MSDENPDATDTTAEPTDSSATPTAGGLPAQTGPFILFRPDTPTTTVALFGHGVDAGYEIAPVSGVTLGYYSPHGDPLDANITWGQGATTYAPQAEEGKPDGQWPSYVLSTIGVGQPAELADTAKEYGIAIAYIVDPTTTETVVGQLASLGFTEIRGVHCRAAVNADDEPTTFGTAVTKTHAELVSESWKDAGGEPVKDDSTIDKDEFVVDPNGGYFTVQDVQDTTAGKTYSLAPHLG